MTGAPHVAVFVARAWWEDGQFRARVTYCVDIDSHEEVRFVTADPDDLRRRLDRWLDDADAATP